MFWKNVIQTNPEIHNPAKPLIWNKIREIDREQHKQALTTILAMASSAPLQFIECCANSTTVTTNKTTVLYHSISSSSSNRCRVTLSPLTHRRRYSPPRACSSPQPQPQPRRQFLAQSAAAAAAALSLSPSLFPLPAKSEDSLSDWERVYLPIDPGVVLLDIGFVPEDPNHGTLFVFYN